MPRPPRCHSVPGPGVPAQPRSGTGTARQRTRRPPAATSGRGRRPRPRRGPPQAAQLARCPGSQAGSTRAGSPPRQPGRPPASAAGPAPTRRSSIPARRQTRRWVARPAAATRRPRPRPPPLPPAPHQSPMQEHATATAARTSPPGLEGHAWLPCHGCCSGDWTSSSRDRSVTCLATTWPATGTLPSCWGTSFQTPSGLPCACHG